jgi:hypothetical protein
MELHRGAYLVRRRLVVTTPAVVAFVGLGLLEAVSKPLGGGLEIAAPNITG